MVQPPKRVLTDPEQDVGERPKRQNSGDMRPRSRRLSSEEEEYTTDETSDDDDDVARAPARRTSKAPRRWQPSEDRKLTESVKQHGEANWKAIAAKVGTRNHVQCLQRWKKVLRPGLVKGQWSAKEDAVLMKLASSGFKNWGVLSNHMPGRTSKQCRERWCHHLDPSINKGAYSPREDKIIIEAQQKLGNKWSQIAAQLPGRTENSIKIRCKALQRRATGNSTNSSNARSTLSKRASSSPVAAAVPGSPEASSTVHDTTSSPDASCSFTSKLSVSGRDPPTPAGRSSSWSPRFTPSLRFGVGMNPGKLDNAGGYSSMPSAPTFHNRQYASSFGSPSTMSAETMFTSAAFDGTLASSAPTEYTARWKSWSRPPPFAEPSTGSCTLSVPPTWSSGTAREDQSFHPSSDAPMTSSPRLCRNAVSMDTTSSFSPSPCASPDPSVCGSTLGAVHPFFAYGASSLLAQQLSETQPLGETQHFDGVHGSTEVPHDVEAYAPGVPHMEARKMRKNSFDAPLSSLPPGPQQLMSKSEEDGLEELGDLSSLDVNDLQAAIADQPEDMAAPLRACCSFLDLPGEGMTVGDVPLTW